MKIMITQFFSRIKNIFSFKSKTKSKTKSIDTSIIQDTNYILITSNPENQYEPYIKLHVVDLSDEACEKFTEALFHLNRGEYHQSFINLMLEMSHQDKDINKFMQQSIIYWSYLFKKGGGDIINNEQNLNKPLISPTEFNKNGKQ